MESWKRLLLENKAWAQDAGSHPPDGDAESAPEFLWIGCSDARVPAERITGSSPGELYVHRNLANLVVHTDVNLLSVLECGVRTLGVGHIIVCGHYQCHGVRAAMGQGVSGSMYSWLSHIGDVWREHKAELSLHDPDTAHRRLVELNVLEQVRNLARTEVVQRTWAEGEGRPVLHGWVYDPVDWRIRPLVKVDAGTPMDDLLRLGEEPPDPGPTPAS